MSRKDLRRLLWHHLNPHTAKVAGCSIHDLQQFLMGAWLDDKILERIARVIFRSTYDGRG